MRFGRGISRPLLFLALIILLSADVAEAGLLDGFKGAFNGIANKVKGLMSNVMTETTKKFSVLSKFFGEGKTRGDLTLPQIFNNIFSRNNSIFLANTDGEDNESELGDGSNVIAAMSTGGSISVTSGNGLVTITTGTSANTNKDKEEDEDDSSDEDESENDTSETGEEEETTNEEATSTSETGEEEEITNEENDGSDSSDHSSDEGNDDESGATESSEPEIDDGATFSGSDLNGAFVELLSDWDRFVTSSIWDVQSEKEPEPSSEAAGDEGSIESTSRVINGVFLGNRIASGAPFAVKFFYNNEENFYCSGSLIGYPYVLTAAHCGVVLGDEVRVGGRLLRSGYKANVGEVITHPEFDPSSLVHDIAIVKLENLESKDVLKENGVKAARINRNDSFPEPGFTGVISAHGSAETDGQGVSDQLLSTRQGIYDIEKCKDEITQGDINDEETYLCAGDGERSTTCVGDSGAGLWHYRVKTTASGKTRRFYEVFGVVSFGEVTDEALCPRGPPTVFQKTSKNYKWIVDVVGKENMP